MNFGDIFSHHEIEKSLTASQNISQDEIVKTLAKNKYDFADFLSLISPKAENFLEEMAKKSQAITKQRFGSTIQLYAPLYLSNYCQNQCKYCGFNYENKTTRKTLNETEIFKEGDYLKNLGLRHILLLTGESSKDINLDYLVKAVKILSNKFASIGLEIYPMKSDGYKKLIESGVDNLTIYQETYHQDTYKEMHKAGPKRDFLNRLNTTDEAGEAEFYRINIGALLGLYDWRYEAIALARHLQYLQKKYWKTRFLISLPRIQKISGEFVAPFIVTDKNLVQFILAFRLVFPDLGITLSTRESAALRDNLVGLGITNFSAGSNTAPGGYSGEKTEKQFEVSDIRSVTKIKKMLKRKGYDIIMKDW